MLFLFVVVVVVVIVIVVFTVVVVNVVAVPILQSLVCIVLNFTVAIGLYLLPYLLQKNL